MSNIIGAYATEQDFSQYVVQSAKTSLAVVGKADRGPFNQPTLVTSTRELIEKFGDLREGYYGMYAAYLFLQQSSSVYFVRASSKDATRAEVDLFMCTNVVVNPGLEYHEYDMKIIMKNPGTHYNGYVLEMKKVGTAEKVVTSADSTEILSTPVYDIKLYDDKGEVVEIYKSVDSMSLESRLSNSRYLGISGTPGAFEYPCDMGLLAGGPSGEKATFAGASDGLAPDDLEYIDAIKTLASESIDMNIVAVPGESSPGVLAALEELATGGGTGDIHARKDFIYLVDTPTSAFGKDEVIAWRNGQAVDAWGYEAYAPIDSSYAALYYNWVTLYDSYNKINVQVPPSVVVAATMAKSDSTADVWYAPAGLKRGVIKGVVDVNGLLSKNDINDLYDHGINSIYKHPTAGVILWGQKTLQRSNTALNRINVRRMLNYLKKLVVASCDTLTFDPNDRIAWNSFSMMIEPVLKNLQDNRAIYEYRLIVGESIVSENDIENHKMPCKILVRPTKTAEEIPINFVITSTGADFDDMLVNNNLV